MFMILDALKAFDTLGFFYIESDFRWYFITIYCDVLFVTSSLFSDVNCALTWAVGAPSKSKGVHRFDICLVDVRYGLYVLLPF